mmetsp:Transcript_21076/g.18693  ORF Transcript_21076/g.18693 Transcript_21076/m.18693 type:complete len:209 (-) Transcript_21076:758-1384(-)
MNFIKTIENTQCIINVFMNIYKEFPEGVMFEDMDLKTLKTNVSFVNPILHQTIYRNKSWKEERKVLNEINSIQNVVLQSNLSEEDRDQNEQDLNLNQLLDFHTKYSIENKVGVESEFDLFIKPDRFDHLEAEDDCISASSYIVKTIYMNCPIYPCRVLHLFLNITNIKELEQQKAACLQLMFASASHEFRTPLNAFSNSLHLLKTNFE